MKNLKLSKGLAFSGLLLLLMLTYFRENFLLEINACIAGDDYNRAYSYWLSGFFKKLSPAELIKWKWGLTLFFSFIMSVVTVFSLYSWFRSIQFTKALILIYIGVILFVTILATIGVAFDSFDAIYFILRKVLGIIQSPLPFFVFFALFYWMEKNQSH